MCVEVKDTRTHSSHRRSFGNGVGAQCTRASAARHRSVSMLPRPPFGLFRNQKRTLKGAITRSQSVVVVGRSQHVSLGVAEWILNKSSIGSTNRGKMVVVTAVRHRAIAQYACSKVEWSSTRHRHADGEDAKPDRSRGRGEGRAERSEETTLKYINDIP